MRASRAVALVALAAASAWLRTRSLDGALWIDEALSRGIASYPLGELPRLLRQDGSPPLYYALLHGWTAAFGESEAALRSLSAVFAVAAVPAAFWAGRAVGGERVGWFAAALAATNPFLTVYGQEARMYALVALLSLVAAGALVRGFVDESRPHRALLAAALALLLWTHTWAFFLVAGAAAALALVARRARRDAALVVLAPLLAFLPWAGVLADQVRHTGAPWSQTPSVWNLLGALPAALDRGLAAFAVAAVALAGLAALAGRERRAALALAAFAVVAVAAAWTAAQVEPSWANRYLAIVAGPVVVLAALGLARARAVGAVALAVVAVAWLGYRAPADKSNVAALAAALAPHVAAGDRVVVTQPEQVPALAYYLGESVRYETPLGPVAEPRVMDWRDALERLRAARPGGVGEAAVLVEPRPREHGWDAPWQRLVLERGAEWRVALLRGSRVVARIAPPPPAERSSDLVATVLRRVRSP